MFTGIRLQAGLSVLLLVVMSPVWAATRVEDDVASRFAGDWNGSGVAFQRPSKPKMKWEPVLGGKFLKLTYKTEMQSAKGEPRLFEGHAYYKSLGGGKYRGTWFDSQGTVHPLEASFDGNTLATNWGTAQTELGKTVYHLREPNKMEVTDSVQKKDGSWMEFGRATLTRE